MGKPEITERTFYYLLIKNWKQWWVVSGALLKVSQQIRSLLERNLHRSHIYVKTWYVIGFWMVPYLPGCLEYFSMVYDQFLRYCFCHTSINWIFNRQKQYLMSLFLKDSNFVLQRCMTSIWKLWQSFSCFCSTVAPIPNLN